jgi:hypothetical protein
LLKKKKKKKKKKVVHDWIAFAKDSIPNFLCILIYLLTYIHVVEVHNRNPCVWWCNYAEQVLSHTRRRRRRRRRKNKPPKKKKNNA